MDFSVSQDINFFAYGVDFYHLQQKKNLLTKSQKWFNLYIKKIFIACLPNEQLNVPVQWEIKKKKNILDFPSGTVDKNPSNNARDMGSVFGLGRSHIPKSNYK